MSYFEQGAFQRTILIFILVYAGAEMLGTGKSLDGRVR